MINNKLILIFILILSLFFLGCVEEKPAGTPVPTETQTASATPSLTAMPTVVTTIPTPTPVPTQIREQKLYTSEIDELNGFRKVTVRNGSAPYIEKTLTINSGDTVKWLSVTENLYYLTVVSKEGLWDNSTSMMKYRLRYFNYTFDKPGEYEVYIKEFPRLTHQKIVVNP
jgi:plastocyanin